MFDHRTGEQQADERRLQADQEDEAERSPSVEYCAACSVDLLVLLSRLGVAGAQQHMDAESPYKDDLGSYALVGTGDAEEPGQEERSQPQSQPHERQ